MLSCLKPNKKKLTWGLSLAAAIFVVLFLIELLLVSQSPCLCKGSDCTCASSSFTAQDVPLLLLSPAFFAALFYIIFYPVYSCIEQKRLRK
ncbi:MAG: hypothetical protein V1725_02150 [archaeon]